VVSALANDPQRFLERNAKLQWGIMVCVYGMSHVPALLLLTFSKDKNAFLVFFLVLVVQTCMVVQHLGPLASPPARWRPISQSFNWRSWWVGMAVGSWAACCRHHPVQAGPGAAHGLDRLCGGSLGHLVMKALKRDRGVTNWGGQGKVGHRRRRPAGPGGCAVFCSAGVLPLGSMVWF
jgi:phosphatidate cytidylyltransferase